MSKSTRPLLTLNRNYTLVTTKGHVVQFAKGVPTYVPPPVYQDAIAIGAVPQDGSDPDVLGDEVVVVNPLTPEERESALLEVFPKMIEANERESFTAAGHPHAKAVSELVGFKTNAKEVQTAWQKYNDLKAE